jgi:hypothetical protein
MAVCLQICDAGLSTQPISLVGKQSSLFIICSRRTQDTTATVLSLDLYFDAGLQAQASSSLQCRYQPQTTLTGWALGDTLKLLLSMMAAVFSGFSRRFGIWPIKVRWVGDLHLYSRVLRETVIGFVWHFPPPL